MQISLMNLDFGLHYFWLYIFHHNLYKLITFHHTCQLVLKDVKHFISQSRSQYLFQLTKIFFIKFMYLLITINHLWLRLKAFNF